MWCFFKFLTITLLEKILLIISLIFQEEIWTQTISAIDLLRKAVWMLATFHQLIGLRRRPPGGSGGDAKRLVIGWGRGDFQWFVNFHQSQAIFVNVCLHLKYTMVHDGNKDEAEKCFNLAQKYFKEGNREKAAWFAQKAERLYPSQQSQGKGT